MLKVLLLCAIELTGVTGKDLRARAFFDANNVRVGDPLVLTIDFLGEAEFSNLHPPALSKAVDRGDWRLDDVSAKTETYRDARRLTYRVRPMREGVVWFPALEFSYSGASGERRTVRANSIPVHARSGAQVVVAGMDEAAEEESMPAPTALVADPLWGLPPGAAPVSEDEAFAWRKACASPSADAFLPFGFPAARINEATCAVREGQWARALGVCRRLEWRVGQTPEIERTMVAAIALRTDNQNAELPVWRQAMRPLLRFAWAGRAGIVLGGVAAITLLFWLLGRAVRALACVAFVLSAACALGETIETVTTNADGSVTKTTVMRSGNGGFSFSMSSTSGGSGGNGVSLPRGFGGDPFGGDPFDMFENFDPFGRGRGARQKFNVGVSLEPDKPSVSVGEDFLLVLSVETPRSVALTENLRLSIDESGMVQQTGNAQTMRPVQAKNPTNVVTRFVFPMRAVAPVAGPLHYSVEGECVSRSRGFSFFRQSTPFASGRRTAQFRATPLPEDGRPEDFGGIVAEGLDVFELPDLIKVCTNDVVTITYKVRPRGSVPPAWPPRDVAFEWMRRNGDDGRLQEIEYRRYFVADGTPTTPRLSVSYWNPGEKRYKTASAGGTKLVYMPD